MEKRKKAGIFFEKRRNGGRRRKSPGKKRGGGRKGCGGAQAEKKRPAAGRRGRDGRAGLPLTLPRGIRRRFAAISAALPRQTGVALPCRSGRGGTSAFLCCRRGKRPGLPGEKGLAGKRLTAAILSSRPAAPARIFRCIFGGLCYTERKKRPRAPAPLRGERAAIPCGRTAPERKPNHDC